MADPKPKEKLTATARVEVRIYRTLAEAAVFLGDSTRPATTIDLLSIDGWASASEALVAALERLAKEIEKDTRRMGINVRDRSHRDPSPGGKA
jgi:hypothetical protein